MSGTRADLYQLVAFAEAFGVEDALLVRFRPPEIAGTPTVQVGAIRVTEASWPADPGVGAEQAATVVVGDVSGWLDSTTFRTGASPLAA